MAKVLEEKQKTRKLDLSKFKNPPIREVTNSHPLPSATDNPTMASIMVTTSTPSPVKMCKRWGPPCLFYAQSTPHPSLVDTDWSEEDCHREIEEKRETKKRREDEVETRRGKEKF